MSSFGKDDGSGVKNQRRKSMNLFSRSSLGGINALTSLDTDLANVRTSSTAPNSADGAKERGKKLSKRMSGFGMTPTSSSSSFHDDTRSPLFRHDNSSSQRLRTRALQKTRPVSIFGSLGKKSMAGTDAETRSVDSNSPESPMEEGGRATANSKSVLYHGEVQTTSGVFRKKKEYLVLTETHLLRFKSQSRASEVFASIPPIYGRATTTRHPSSTSIGSMQEAHSNHSHNSHDYELRIPLAQIVTAYKLEDGRPFFTTEVVYLDEECHGVGSVQLMLQSPNDADLWHTSIRGAAQKARLMAASRPYPKRVIRYLVKILEAANDYHPDHFKVFRVVRRAAVSKPGKSSSEDLQKLGILAFYMVIGINRLHLIPLPDYSDPSGRLINTKVGRNTFGLASLIAMNVSNTDDRFELTFRFPLQPAKVLDLACSASPDIATAVSRAWQYVKPMWWDYSFTFTGPEGLLDSERMVPDVEDKAEAEYGCFDRTLIAYCAAYNVSHLSPPK